MKKMKKNHEKNWKKKIVRNFKYIFILTPVVSSNSPRRKFLNL